VKLSSTSRRILGALFYFTSLVFLRWLMFKVTRKQPEAPFPFTSETKQLSTEPVRAGREKIFKVWPEIVSLGIDVFIAVATSSAQRYARSWKADLQVRTTRSLSALPVESSLMNTRLKSPSQTRDAGKPRKQKLSVRSIPDLLKQTTTEWLQDRCFQLGAALAYFTIFSLAPLVLVLLAVFGFVFGSSEAGRDRITEQLQYFVDPSGVKVVKDIAAQTAKPNAGFVGASIGVIVALFGASGVFGQLQEALNAIWGVKPKPGSGIWSFLRARFLSFAMVGGVCFLLLVSLTIETILRALNDYLAAFIPGGHILGMTLFLLLDILVIALLFAFIFRYLPDAKIAWRDVWIGSSLTAVLFVLGKFILALYLGSGAAGSAYGAASSLITLLLWIYYSSLILLFGAEFTQVFANTYGSLVKPKEHAVKVEVTEREVQ
jgi:membrane protein